MSILNSRPTFGVAGAAAPPVQQQERKEIGAIWKAMTKANKPIYNVKLNLPKSKVEELLSKAEGDTVQVSLVGFDNEYAQGDSKRPVIRMYEERNK